MGRVLAIDYGKKRTGVAVTDPLQLIANGLTTVSTSSVMDFIVLCPSGTCGADCGGTAETSQWGRF